LCTSTTNPNLSSSRWCARFTRVAMAWGKRALYRSIFVTGLWYLVVVVVVVVFVVVVVVVVVVVGPGGPGVVVMQMFVLAFMVGP